MPENVLYILEAICFFGGVYLSITLFGNIIFQSVAIHASLIKEQPRKWDLSKMVLLTSLMWTIFFMLRSN